MKLKREEMKLILLGLMYIVTAPDASPKMKSDADALAHKIRAELGGLGE